MDPTELEKMAMMQGLSEPPVTMSDDFSKWRLQMEDVIEVVEHNLRGEKWDNDSKKWVELGTRIMNEEGVVSISSTLSLFLNKNAFLSNFSEDDVLNLTKNIHKTLCTDLYYNWQRWKFKPEYNIITRKIAILVFMGLKRAQEEGERLALRQSERIVRTFSEGNRDSSKFPSLPSIFGGSSQ